MTLRGEILSMKKLRKYLARMLAIVRCEAYIFFRSRRGEIRVDVLDENGNLAIYVLAGPTDVPLYVNGVLNSVWLSQASPVVKYLDETNSHAL